VSVPCVVATVLGQNFEYCATSRRAMQYSNL
jgi:hypothetical protein